MLDEQPELQIIDVYVALTKTPKEKRVAYGSLGFGVGERKILSKSFTVFRSPRTGGLYISWPTYTSVVDGKTVYKDCDMWIDVEEAKYWQNRIISETNRLLGIDTVTASGKPKTTEVTTTEEPPAEPVVKPKRVGWKQK